MAKSNDSNCPVTRGEVDLAWYAERDQVWVALGIPSPARRALVNAELFTLSDLRKFSRKELAAQHGMGPKALTMLDAALADKGWGFKQA